MTQTKKFSQFNGPDPIQAGDIVVGLRVDADGVLDNWQFTGVGSGGGGSGAVTQVIIQPNSFSLGQWVRFDEATQLYVTAIATTRQFAEVIGVVIAVAPPGGPPFSQFTLQQSGYITAAQGVFAPGSFIGGQPQFLSDTVLGGMMNVDVLIDGEVSRPVFLPDGDSHGWVLPYRGIIAGGGEDTGGGAPTPGTDSNIVTVVQNGHGLNPGDWVRIDPPQAGPQVHYVKALADTLQHSQSVGVVIQLISANSFRLQFSGYVETNAGTSTTAPFQDAALAVLVPTTVYYLSSTVAGAITSVDPGLATGGFSKPLFISEQTIGTVNANAGYILPQRPLASAVENNPVTKVITQAGHGFTMIGTIVKPSTVTPGVYVAAVATSFIPSYGTAMIVGIPDVNTIILQEVGYVTGLDIAPPVPGGTANTATPFAIGQPYYLDVVSGHINNVEPVSPNFSKPMFMPDQAGAGWIFPMKPTRSNGNIFLGNLNQANGFSSQTILTGIFAGYEIIFIANAPLESSGGGNTGFGFQFFSSATGWETSAYTHFFSGVNTSANPITTGVLYGDVHVGGVETMAVINSPVSNVSSLTIFKAFLSAAQFNFSGICVDNSIDPLPGGIVYTAFGMAGGGNPGVGFITGLRLVVSGGATIQPSTGFFAVYGVPLI